MSDRDALLAAIRQSPDDDAPRLVYADWLDEHGDPNLAQFIRLQVEIDPYRRPDTDVDRWRRATVDLHLDRPVPDDFPPQLHRYAELARREHDLLRAHRWEWLAPLVRLDNDSGSNLSVTFRRGFAEEVSLTTSAFLGAGDVIRATCPLLRRLTLYGPRDRGPELAAMSALGGIPELELAGWITPFDARFLAGSFALPAVRSLTLWVGRHDDEEVIRTLATRPFDEDEPVDSRRLLGGPHLSSLREMVLVQLHGWAASDEDAAFFDSQVDDLAADFDRILGRGLAKIKRPFAERFPLNGRIGDDLFAGHTAELSVLVAASRWPSLLYFDGDGYLAETVTIDLDDRLSRVPAASRRDYSEAELLSLLGREYGFVLGPIFVRGFVSDTANVSVKRWGQYEDDVVDPDTSMHGDEQEGVCASLGGYWMNGGHFVVATNDEYWAGPDGTIHTS